MSLLGTMVIKSEKQSSRKDVFLPCASQVVLYVIQFFLLPAIIHIYPTDASRQSIALIFTTAVTTVLFGIHTRKILFWLLSFILYILLVVLYHPDYLYGIGYGMFAAPIFSIIPLCALVLIVELASLLILWIINRFRRS